MSMVISGAGGLLIIRDSMEIDRIVFKGSLIGLFLFMYIASLA